MSICAALDALNAAYEARDAARDRAVAEVDRQFRAIIARRQREFQDATRRSAERNEPESFTGKPAEDGDGRSAVALGNGKEPS